MNPHTSTPYDVDQTVIRNSARGAMVSPIRAMDEAVMQNTVMVRHKRTVADCAVSRCIGGIHNASDPEPEHRGGYGWGRSVYYKRGGCSSMVCSMTIGE
jgi:hypothetical protein